MNGEADTRFLAQSFQKLLLNFTWWLNRKDRSDRNLFEGGFLGLDNIGAVGGNIDQLAANIDGINTTVQQFIPLLDQYIGVLDQTTASLENARAQVNANLNTIKLVATGLLAWFALYQIVPLYVGYRMLSDKVVEGTFEERVEALEGDSPRQDATEALSLIHI